VVTQVAKQYREQIAVALLAVAVVYIASGLGLLFKGYDFANVNIGFADKAALDGFLFSHPVMVACLAIAALLVAVWGEPSAHARTFVLAAIGIGAVALVFAVITWIAAFSASGRGVTSFAGIAGAGKVVGAFIVLAQIALLVVVLFFAGVALQALPRPVPARPHWGSPYQTGWAPAQNWQQPGQWPGQHPQHAAQPTDYGPGMAAPWTAPPAGPWAQPGKPTAWGAPPYPGEFGAAPQPSGWEGGYSPSGQPATEAQSVDTPNTPESNADLYWRATTEPGEPSDEPAQPSHLADAPADAEKPADDGPTAVRSWSEDAGPSAAEVATADAVDPDSPGPEYDDEEHTSDDGTDTSGWWRPSSS
jgi:hypothetical protein